MPCFTGNRRYVPPTTILFLVLILPTSTLAQSPLPSQPLHHKNTNSPYGDYSPPMATILIVVVGLFFTAGFLSVYLRHYASCFNILIGNQPRHGGPSSFLNRYNHPGLDPSLIDSFPTFLYSDVKIHRLHPKPSLECAICITEFSDNETLKLLPGCCHVFHPNCIGPWLSSHVTCPVCRANLEFHDHCPPFDWQQQLSENNSNNNDQSEPLDQTTATTTTPQQQSQPSNNSDVIIPISPHPFNDGRDRMGKLPRSHSTGHSLIGDCERFTLRLPEEVIRNKVAMITTPNNNLPDMVSSPRIGYRTGSPRIHDKPDRWRFSVSPPFFIRPGSGDTSPVFTGPRSIFKMDKSPLNRAVRCCDIGERSSDKLWPNRPDQDSDSEHNNH